ncbi:MAG: hypothetical protein ACJ8LG_21435 [Massilia sp.]
MAARLHSCEAGPGLDQKVAFLREAASYTEPAYRVEAVETHMSWVFLLDDFAYKLKKPICDKPLDCRTLAARHYLCREELRLNRRLAPEVYLGITPLTLDQRGHLALGGDGAVVDWLVRMRRLPDGQMLDYAIRHKALADTDLLRLAARLSAFYSALPAEPLTPQRYRNRLSRRVLEACGELLLDAYALPPEQVRAIRAAQLAALKRNGPMLDARVRAGRIVEGHGDLRPEHVYLGVPLAIIDCLEFSHDLRVVDVADELGFLALECERLGAPEAGVSLLGHCNRITGDTPAPTLVHFYQSCRATTRAVLAGRHLLDQKFCHSPHWVSRASHYLRLAEEHIHWCV